MEDGLRKGKREREFCFFSVAAVVVRKRGEKKRTTAQTPPPRSPPLFLRIVALFGIFSRSLVGSEVLRGGGESDGA